MMARAGLSVDMHMEVASMDPQPYPLRHNGDLLHCNGLFSCRKRSHPDPQFCAASDNCTNGFVLADAPNGVILDGTKRACLDSIQDQPQLAGVAVSGGDVPMECAASPGRVNGIWSHTAEGPVAKPPEESSSLGSSFSARKLQLCSMTAPCCSSNISALECPRCLAGEPGHLKHIFDSHSPAPHRDLQHTHNSSSDLLTMALT